VFVCVSACVGVVCVNVGVVTSFENASSSGSLPSPLLWHNLTFTKQDMNMK
jgi:hypothetical protein